MISIVISTIVFFVAGYFARRWLDDIGIPRGVTRSLVAFTIALGAAYGVAFIVNWLVS